MRKSSENFFGMIRKVFSCLIDQTPPLVAEYKSKSKRHNFRKQNLFFTRFSQIYFKVMDDGAFIGHSRQVITDLTDFVLDFSFLWKG